MQVSHETRRAVFAAECYSAAFNSPAGLLADDGEHNGVGSHRDDASNVSALAAISCFLRSVRRRPSSAETPSDTARTISALVTWPRKFASEGRLQSARSRPSA